ncbi:MAG TPA: glycosyltransferase family 39 protein [Ottowia sp.]|uniref:ArnT family glycosyltransferase n=1 Tax=Ottowia sp. TaxID=1898956 RepID=UPI002C33E19B|nr:glycosyltransferase family 39 protein [Ottowia sp.]HMN20886.1 glycosyltransferase family 39 protein [Ottowia sp.]
MNVPARSDARPLAWPLAHPLAWFALLALAQVAVRLVVSPALKWDEAEQMLWSQQILPGYGPQPPLYTWLQWAMNGLLGPSVLSLAVLKQGLLALTYGFMWLGAREVLGPRAAFWASAGMVLLPALGWFSIRDQTHTILVSTMACGAWWMLIRIVRHQRPADFAWLGLFCGLGMLAKYNFALFAAALLLAALTVPEARRALLARGWWWAPLVALLVVLPHSLWLLHHVQEATSGTLRKMEMGRFDSIGRGLLKLTQSWVGSVLLWSLAALAAFGAAWWRPPRSDGGADPARTRWLAQLGGCYLLLVTLPLLAMVLLAHVTSFRDRWLLPLLCGFPLIAMAWRPQLDFDPRGRRLSGAIIGFALLTVLVAGVRPWIAARLPPFDELNHPIAKLADALRGAGYDGKSPILGADHMLAGALRTRFPAAPIYACGFDEAAAPCLRDFLADPVRRDGGWLVISRADRLAPNWWAQALQAMPAASAAAGVHQIELPYLMAPAGAPLARYDYLWHPAAAQP